MEDSFLKVRRRLRTWLRFQIPKPMVTLDSFHGEGAWSPGIYTLVAKGSSPTGVVVTWVRFLAFDRKLSNSDFGGGAAQPQLSLEASAS